MTLSHDSHTIQPGGLNRELNGLLSKCDVTPALGPVFQAGTFLRLSLELFPEAPPKRPSQNLRKALSELGKAMDKGIGCREGWRDVAQAVTEVYKVAGQELLSAEDRRELRTAIRELHEKSADGLRNPPWSIPIKPGQEIEDKERLGVGGKSYLWDMPIELYKLYTEMAKDNDVKEVSRNSGKIFSGNPYPLVTVVLNVKPLGPWSDEDPELIAQAAAVIQDLSHSPLKEVSPRNAIHQVKEMALEQSLHQLLEAPRVHRADLKDLVFAVYEDCGDGSYLKRESIVTNDRGQAFIPEVKGTARLRMVHVETKGSALPSTLPADVDLGRSFLRKWKCQVVALGSVSPHLLPLRFEYPIAGPLKMKVEIQESKHPDQFPELRVLAPLKFWHRKVRVQLGEKRYSIVLGERDGVTDCAWGRRKLKHSLWDVISTIDKVTVRVKKQVSSKPPVAEPAAEPEHAANADRHYALYGADAQAPIEPVVGDFWIIQVRHVGAALSLDIRVLKSKIPSACVRLRLIGHKGTSTTRLLAMWQTGQEDYRECVCRLSKRELPAGFEPLQKSSYILEEVQPESVSREERRQLEELISNSEDDPELSSELKVRKMTLSFTVDSECIIDQKDLLTRCMGNKRFAVRILDAFLRQLNSDLDELEAAVQNENLGQVAVISHRIKGASSNASARRLNSLATSMSELAKIPDMGQLRESCLALRYEQQQFMESAKRFADAVG